MFKISESDLNKEIVKRGHVIETPIENRHLYMTDRHEYWRIGAHNTLIAQIRNIVYAELVAESQREGEHVCYNCEHGFNGEWFESEVIATEFENVQEGEFKFCSEDCVDEWETQDAWDE